ncbi:MAG: ribosome recycling factor [Bacteroidota bacterium]
MQEDVNDQIEMAKIEMDDTINHLSRELTKIRAGKASPAALEGIMVDYYGAPTPLNQVANISTPDAKTLSIQPWEKKMIGAVEQAIFAANIGLTPMNNGEMVMINIPPLTEERRKEFVKRAKSLGEDAKVSLRSARHKVMDFIKKAVKDGYPEDMGKRKEDEVQKLVNSYGDKVNALVKTKENDIMTI